MNLFDSFQQGLPYAEFLQRHGTEVHRNRWAGVRAQVELTPPQKELLGSFTRTMPVLCLAGGLWLIARNRAGDRMPRSRRCGARATRRAAPRCT